MSDFSTTDNDDFSKENEKQKKRKHFHKKTLSSIKTRENIYKRQNHFSLGISRYKIYSENTTLILNSNKDIAIISKEQNDLNTNNNRYDVYGTKITKGGKFHKVSFIDELKHVPIADIHEYEETINNKKERIYKRRNSLYKKRIIKNDKDVVYCSSCVII